MPGSRIAARQALVGQVFGRLTVLAILPSRSGKYFGRYQCACGNVVELPLAGVKHGNTKSCGCLRREATSQRRLIHGATKAPADSSVRRTFNVWVSLRARCTNPKNSRYASYGARGISYDPRWDIFQNFLDDMGLAPEGYSIERENNDLGYCKNNCHWIPKTKQAQNRQDTIWIRYEGQNWCFKRLCEYLGQPYLRTYKRYVLRGWELQRALELPELKDLQRIDPPQGTL